MLEETRRLIQDQRVVSAEDEIWRFIWTLIYRDGRKVEQYRTSSGQVIQTLFGLQDSKGISMVYVHDIEGSRIHPIVVFRVPEDGEVDILLNRKIEQNKRTGVFGPIQTLYTFGWKSPSRSLYFNVLPTRQAWWSTDRSGTNPTEMP